MSDQIISYIHVIIDVVSGSDDASNIRNGRATNIDDQKRLRHCTSCGVIVSDTTCYTIFCTPVHFHAPLLFLACWTHAQGHIAGCGVGTCGLSASGFGSFCGAVAYFDRRPACSSYCPSTKSPRIVRKHSIEYMRESGMWLLYYLRPR